MRRKIHRHEKDMQIVDEQVTMKLIESTLLDHMSFNRDEDYCRKDAEGLSGAESVLQLRNLVDE